MVHRLLCVAIVATLQIATVGGGLAQWSTAELSAWLADELELPNVAAEVARAGIDGDRAQSMEKSDWRSVGATGLQAAKLRARVVKAAQDDSNPPPVAAGRPPAGPKFAVDEIVDVETEDGVERGVRILGAATSGSPDELRCRSTASAAAAVTATVAACLHACMHAPVSTWLTACRSTWLRSACNLLTELLTTGVWRTWRLLSNL